MKMKPAKISVIIPVYQAEKYLSECIESVLGQNASFFEIILVDDGSTDQSVAICDEYARKNCNIKVIHQKNGGQASARNVGIEMASGKYLMFLDADDMLADADILRHMTKKMIKTNADILAGNFCYYKNGHIFQAKKHHLKSGSYVKTKEFRFQGFYRFGHLSYVWGKMYKKSFLKEHQIVFKKYELGEDKIFNLECYLKGAIYEFTDRNVIFYRQIEESQTSRYHHDFMKNWIRLGKEYEKEMKLCHAPRAYEDILTLHYFFGAYFLIRQEILYRDEKVHIKKYIRLLEKYVSFPDVSAAFKKLSKTKYYKGYDLSFYRFMIQGISIWITKKWYIFFIWMIFVKK